MKKINGIALTEKGKVKQALRNAIAENERATLDNLQDYERIGNSNVYVKTFEDNKGNKVYSVLTLTITEINPDKPKESKPRKSRAKETETFELID